MPVPRGHDAPMRLPLAVVALALVAPLTAWADITGPARVIDGDTIEVAGEQGHFVDLAGSANHILGVIVPRGDTTWFYKLSGPDRLVAGQRAAFEAFVGSIRFEGDPSE